MAGFCIDESSFQRVDDLHARICRLNDQLSTIHNDHEQQVFKSSELDYVEVIKGIQFFRLLYEGALDLIDHDDRILLMQAIDRCVFWDDDTFDIPDDPVKLNGKITDCSSIKFVASQALEKSAIGIISLLSTENEGVCEAAVGGAAISVFHIGSTTTLEPFYRFKICLEEISKDDFEKWVERAFPRLRFALAISTQLRRFRQRYEDIRELIVDHLACVNDEFLSLLTDGMQLHDVCDQVKSIRGVDISPESPNTHGNASAMTEREVEFRNETIVCEFHTKLTPTHDRIHFSPTVYSEEDGRKFLVIGAFAEHLTT